MAPRPNGILLLSSGSKVAISRIAKESAQRRGLILHGTDRIPNVPTRLSVDAFAVLDDRDREQWGQQLLDYCQTHRIGLVVPTRHSDLLPLSALRNSFSKLGIVLALSDEKTLRLCIDKLETARFLTQYGIPTPASQRASQGPPADFPLFAKPNQGSAAAGARRIDNAEQLAQIPPDWLLQKCAAGDEFTVNLYLDKTGKPLCSIPHRRIAIENGEVVQARTERHPALMELCERIARVLPGARGIINIQAFRDPESTALTVIEINPRIGGGFPLAHQAKGHFIEWLCCEYLDNRTLEPFDAWTDGLRMMRYREGLFSLD